MTVELPGRGSDHSCSCDLSHSCGNTRSLATGQGRGSNRQPSTPETPPSLRHDSGNSTFYKLFLGSFLLLLGPLLQHMEVPRLGGLIRAIATSLWDPSHICDLHHSSWQYQILNPLSEARDRTRNLMVPSWIC